MISLSLVRSNLFPWRSLCCSGCRRSGVTGGSSACWTGSRLRGRASCWCWSDHRIVRICSTSSLREDRCPNASHSGSSVRSWSRCGSFTLTAWCTETSRTRTSWWTRGRWTSRSSTLDQELHSKRRRTASSKVATRRF